MIGMAESDGRKVVAGGFLGIMEYHINLSAVVRLWNFLPTALNGSSTSHMLYNDIKIMYNTFEQFYAEAN